MLIAAERFEGPEQYAARVHGRVSRARHFKLHHRSSYALVIIPARLLAVGIRHLRRFQRLTVSLGRWLVEISCSTLAGDGRSLRHEHVRASNKPRSCIGRQFRLFGISLDAGVERFAAIAPALSSGRELRRAQLRCDDDRLRRLQSCIPSSAGWSTGSDHSIFENPGADSSIRRIAVSCRTHFRARAAAVRLSTQVSRVLAER